MNHTPLTRHHCSWYNTDTATRVHRYTNTVTIQTQLLYSLPKMHINEMKEIKIRYLYMCTAKAHPALQNGTVAKEQPPLQKLTIKFI